MSNEVTIRGAAVGLVLFIIGPASAALAVQRIGAVYILLFVVVMAALLAIFSRREPVSGPHGVQLTLPLCFAVRLPIVVVLTGLGWGIGALASWR